MKRFVLITMMTVFTVCLAMIATCCTNKKPEPQVIEPVMVDTFVYTPEQAACEMLQLQDDIIYRNMIDSTFRQMPEDIIIRIMLKHPTWTIEDVVHEYINNKKRYDEDKYDFEKIKKFRNPDTISTKAKADLPKERCKSNADAVPLNYVLQ